MSSDIETDPFAHPLQQASQPQLNESANGNIPISRLPNEIIMDIFEFGHNADDYPRFEPQTDAPPLPFQMLITQVFRRWRYIAVAMSVLWSRIPVSTAKEQLAILHLERCADRPIKLLVKCLSTRDPEAIWFNELYRCRSLIITTVGNAVETVLSCLDIAAAPVLEEFVLQTTGDMSSHPISYGEIFLGGTPLLSRLVLDGVTLEHCRPKMEFITHLELTDNGNASDFFELQDAITWLDGLNMLNHLSLGGLSLVLRGSSLPPSLISLPALHSLAVDWDGFDEEDLPSDDTLFLEALNAPALKQISISNANYTEVLRTAEAFRKNKITRLCVSFRTPGSGGGDNTDHIVASAEIWPLVESLVLGNGDQAVNGHMDILRVFCRCDQEVTRLDRNEPIWPSLKHLHVHENVASFQSLVFSFFSTREAIGRPILKLTAPNMETSALFDELRSQVSLEICDQYRD